MITKEGATELSLLSTALIAEQYELAETLLESGADAQVLDKEGNNTLHLLADYYMVPDEKEAFAAALFSDSEEQAYRRLIKILIASGVDINAKNKNAETPLFKAIASNRATSLGSPPIDLIKTLLEFKALPSIGSPTSTPLHHAVCWDVLELTKILIEKAASVNAKDQEGATPIFKVKSTQMLKLLLALKADPVITSENGRTPLHCCMEEMIPAFVKLNFSIETVDKKGLTPLATALLNADAPRCKILLENGANPNGFFSDGDSYLNRTISSNNKSIVGMLLEYKAYANVKDKRGNLSIDLAMHYSQKQLTIARMLLKYGINANDVIKNEQTVLHRALTCESSSFVAEMMNASIEVPRNLNSYLPKISPTDNIAMYASFLLACQIDDISTFARNVLKKEDHMLLLEIQKIEFLQILSQSHIQYLANMIENHYLKMIGYRQGDIGVSQDTQYLLYDYDALEKFTDSILDDVAPTIFEQYGKELQEIIIKLSEDESGKAVKIPNKPSKEKDASDAVDPIENSKYWLLYIIKICVKSRLAPRVEFCFLKPYIEVALFEDFKREDSHGYPLSVLPGIVPATAAKIIVSYMAGVCTGSEYEHCQDSVESSRNMADVLPSRLHYLRNRQEQCHVSLGKFNTILKDRNSPLLPLYEELIKKPKQSDTTAPQITIVKGSKRPHSDTKDRKFKKFS